MTIVEQLKILMTADASGVEKELRKTNNSLSGLGTAVKGAAGALAGLFAAGKVADFALDSAKAFMEAERAERQLASVAGEATDALKLQASVLQSSLGVSDETVMGLQTMALRFGVLPRNIDSTVRAVLDFAAATGQDAPAAMNMLLRGVDSGDESLGRLGIRYKATGKLNEDLAAAVTSLGEKFGGAAATNADTFAGHLDKLKEAFSDLQEGFGGLFGVLESKLHILETMTALLAKSADFLGGGASKSPELLESMKQAFNMQREQMAILQKQRTAALNPKALNQNFGGQTRIRDAVVEGFEKSIGKLADEMFLQAGAIEKQRQELGLSKPVFAPGGTDKKTAKGLEFDKAQREAQADAVQSFLDTVESIKKAQEGTSDEFENLAFWGGQAAQMSRDLTDRMERFGMGLDVSIAALFEEARARDRLTAVKESGQGAVSQLPGGEGLLSGDPILALIGAVAKIFTQTEGFQRVFSALSRIFTVIANVAAENLTILAPSFEFLAKLLEDLEPLLMLMQDAVLAVTQPMQTLWNLALPALTTVVAGLTVSILYAAADIADFYNGMLNTLEIIFTNIAQFDVLGAKPFAVLADLANMLNGAEVDTKALRDHATAINYTTKPVDKLGDASMHAADSIDRFSESLTNVPAGFRVAAARYNATMADGGGGTIGTIGQGLGGESTQINVYVGNDKLETLFVNMQNRKSFQQTGDYGMGSAG